MNEKDVQASARPQDEAVPPRQPLHWQRAVLWLSLGFLTLLVLTWCDGLFDLAHHISGRTRQTEHNSEILIKSVVILFLWLIAAYKIYKIVSRLSYLERFLHVCAWCRKIEQNNKWLSLEEMFLTKTGQQASHGICPDCAQKVRQKTKDQGT